MFFLLYLLVNVGLGLFFAIAIEDRGASPLGAVFFGATSSVYATWIGLRFVHCVRYAVRRVTRGYQIVADDRVEVAAGTFRRMRRRSDGTP